MTPIRSPQVRQRPPSATQLATGMFSYQDNARLHFVQCEPGQFSHGEAEDAEEHRRADAHAGRSVGSGHMGESSATVTSPHHGLST
jgi:hypothetical protein